MVSEPVHADLGWKTVIKTGDNWSRSDYTGSGKNFTTFQENALLLYGTWPAPEVMAGTVTVVHIPDSGFWILRSLDPHAQIAIESSVWKGTLDGDGAIFVDTTKKTLVNFDANAISADNTPILPSFAMIGGQSVFFDIGEQKDVVPADLWSLYTTFLLRDETKALGNVTKKNIDDMIQTLLQREPSDSSGFFHHDLSVRDAIGNVSTLIAKIEKGEACDADVTSCFSALDDIIQTNKKRFPEVFWPLEKAINAWIQTDTDVTDNILTWKGIFRTYHMNFITANPRARIVRDKAILEMVRTGNTGAYYEMWQYLTQMLANQKLGSVYSLQIMREMIRIGESLRQSKTITDTIKSTLTKTAIDSLKNLRDLLENAYFTKQDYWFVLRSDLTDNEGKPVQTDALVGDLQALISEIDHSTLLQLGQNPWSEDDLQVIRAQLAWFNCIFSRNAEYTNNPRVCRTVVGQ